jgi:hypothetical protein
MRRRSAAGSGQSEPSSFATGTAGLAPCPVAELGGTALPLSPADFGKLMADETEKWGRVIRAANIKAE